jgi:hypothetical protein
MTSAFSKVKVQYSCPWPRHDDFKGEVQLSQESVRTSALDEGEWSNSCSGGFPTGKALSAPFEYEAGWAPQPVWTF